MTDCHLRKEGKGAPERDRFWFLTLKVRDMAGLYTLLSTAEQLWDTWQASGVAASMLTLEFEFLTNGIPMLKSLVQALLKQGLETNVYPYQQYWLAATTLGAPAWSRELLCAQVRRLAKAAQSVGAQLTGVGPYTFRKTGPAAGAPCVTAGTSLPFPLIAAEILTGMLTPYTDSQKARGRDTYELYALQASRFTSLIVRRNRDGSSFCVSAFIAREEFATRRSVEQATAWFLSERGWGPSVTAYRGPRFRQLSGAAAKQRIKRLFGGKRPIPGAYWGPPIIGTPDAEVLERICQRIRQIAASSRDVPDAEEQRSLKTDYVYKSGQPRLS